VARLIHLENVFPNLAAAGYEKTSDATGQCGTPGTYNCIGWAANDVRHDFWWPLPGGYWPFWINRQPTVIYFVKTFRWFGYRVCKSSRREFGYHKIALYAIHQSHQRRTPPTVLEDLRDWEPTHMARQLADGSWTSKCGGNEDITHFTLDALESYGPRYGPNRKEEYGCAVIYMRRLIPISWIVHMLQRIRCHIEERVAR